MEQRLSVGAILKEALSTVANNFKTFTLAFFAWIGLYILCYAALAGVVLGLVKIIVRCFLPLSYLKEMIENKGGAVEPVSLILGFLLVIAIIAIAVGLNFGFRHFVMRLDDTKKGCFSLLLSGFSVLIPAMVAGTLFLLISMSGIILLIVPGIYFGVRFSLYSYALLDNHLGALDALRKSYRITEGNFWPLFFLNLIAVSLALVMRIFAGKLAGLLLISTFGWLFIVVVHSIVYRKLCELRSSV